MIYKVCAHGSSASALTSEDLRELYEITKAERQLYIMARDIKEDVTPEMFEAAARASWLFMAGYNPANGKPYGFIYLLPGEGQTCRIHFCIFKEGLLMRHCIATQAIRFLFGCGTWPAFVGLIPSVYYRARRFAMELGAEYLGDIPGACDLARLGQHVAGSLFVYHRPEEA